MTCGQQLVSKSGRKNACLCYVFLRVAEVCVKWMQMSITKETEFLIASYFADIAAPGYTHQEMRYAFTSAVV